MTAPATTWRAAPVLSAFHWRTGQPSVLGTEAEIRRQRKSAAGAANASGRPMADIDMARVHDLRKQGWSLRAIAKEMDCSHSTLANRLLSDTPREFCTPIESRAESDRTNSIGVQR